MHTTNFSKAVGRLIQYLGAGTVKRAICRHDQDNDIYYLFEADEPAELEFIDRHPGNKKILDLDFFQMKVFIHEIKTLQNELGINGTNKENSQDRQCSGSDDIGLDAGTAGAEPVGSGCDTELPGPNDNDSKGNSANDSGNQTGETVATRPIGEPTPEEKASIIEENTPDIPKSELA